MRLYDYYSLSQFHFSGPDIMIGLLVILIILAYGLLKAVRNRESNPLYKYYFSGLVVKMFGAATFALVYGLLYSAGGDTVAYWWGAESLKNLLYSNWEFYLSEMFNSTTDEGYFNHYNSNTSWPPTWLYRSDRHFFLCRIISVICTFIPGSFLGVSAFMGLISYNGIWKLFETFTHHFPDRTKKIRIAILLLPSTLFWCSGIMKDTVVLTGICWIVHETDLFLRPELKKKPFRMILRILIWGWLILSIKPYVIIALAPAWLLWMNYSTLSKIRSTILKYYLIPTFLTVSTLIIFQIYSVSTIDSEYSPDNLVDQALVTRNDFSTNATYGTNRYAATATNNSGASLIRALPESLISGLFRPFIWEARTPFILISALENVFLVGFLILAFYKLGIKGFVKYIRSHPLILFSFVFSILLGLIVGFTTVLFGTLIRFRTPFLPFLFCFVILAAGKVKSLKVVSGYSSIRPNE